MKKYAIKKIAFQLISSAGMACDYFYQALEAARNRDFAKTEALLEAGDKELTQAHMSQSEFLAAEARGDEIEYSVIMAHAQDSLMTTVLFERVVKEFILLYKERGAEGDR